MHADPWVCFTPVRAIAGTLSLAPRAFACSRTSQSFEIHSRVVFWDDDWQYLLAQFKCPESGQIYAEGLSRVMLRQGRERVNPRLLHADIGLVDLPDRKDMPASIQQLLQWDAVTEQSMKRTAEALAPRAKNGGEIPSSNIQMVKAWC
ncbi:hypothetical protein Poli38472_009552 [Pythium oligandrum]|uniref:Uncharacterized protein n=1 Tax=Pythium oligandrum TaxID=41045 RepID=A0A8K1CFG0_PYTOL|nr:hypothetical protein Poli38472_009552 [Pythium oligandrum]|eukprot:TMW62059.1 hypothetical protein Poli38472_009552 [Pythium oligandrum]